jgi:tetratricopeptide (TPR) repeat protein
MPRDICAGYLGIEWQNQQGTNGVQPGVRAVKVRPGGPAAKAGIQPQDLIVALDDKPVLSAGSLADTIRRTAAGTPLVLKVLRDGRIINVTVILAVPPVDMADYQRGRGNLEKGKNEQAITDFTKAIRVNPTDAELYFYRAKAYENQQKHDLALADYTKAIELNPGVLSPYGSRGALYRKMRLYDQAIQDFTKAIELSPKMAPIYVDRGRTYFLKGSYDQAIADCGRAIELEPKLDSAYLVRADSYEKKGMKQEAMADKERTAQAYIDNGLEMGRKGDLDGAMLKFDAAIKINTRHLASAYYNRGVVYEKKGDNLKAINDFSEAIRNNPQYAEAYLRRGYVFAQRLKDYGNAKKDWEKALELDRGGKIGQTARESLEKLRDVR